MHILSEPRKVTWHLPLELGEVARDRGHVEAPEDRFHGLAVEQEPERHLDTAFWRMLPRRQPLAHLSRHGDVVTGLTLSFADDHHVARDVRAAEDRKSTRLNSSHGSISYAVFCLTKK